MKEIWKDIPNYERLYQVSNLGRIKSLYYSKEKILTPKIDKDGYLLINLYKNHKSRTFKIHRIVAQVFLSNPNNYTEVNHKDENKKNNKVDNLEFCTHIYNQNYGSKNDWCSKKVNQYDLNGNYIKTYSSLNKASKELNISNNIYLCCTGKIKTCGGYIWKYVS